MTLWTTTFARPLCASAVTLRLLARRCAAACLPWALAACTATAPPTHAPAPTPAAWQAPLPHGGSVAQLGHWWRQLQDPLLADLIERAQTLAPSVAQARMQVAQARATQTAARAALGPQIDGQAAAQRGLTQQLPHTATTAQVGLQAAWELDLFGGNAAAADAARERLWAAQAQWHEARIGVAAEVALQYSSLRTCLRLLDVAQADARSRAETARLTQLSAKAGFTPPAMAALADASHADSAQRTAQQAMQCEIERKTLVALTGLDEPTLRARLAAAPATAAPDALFAIDTLPVQLLAQRPDVYAAEREVAAASADVGLADAQRYPRLSLSGSVATGRVRMAGADSSASTWSIGPLALTVPLLDGGRRNAQLEAARARYEGAVALYQARVRQAVAEVEQALVRLQSTAQRRDDAQRAARGYQAAFDATQARWNSGLASVVELEDARRTALMAQTTLQGLEHERMAAWIALYRAAGGGWQPPEHPASAPADQGNHRE